MKINFLQLLCGVLFLTGSMSCSPSIDPMVTLNSPLRKADSSSKQNVSSHLIVKNYSIPTEEAKLNYFKAAMIQIRNPQWLRESDRLSQILRDEQTQLKARNKK